MDRTKDPRLLAAIAGAVLVLFGFGPGDCGNGGHEDEDRPNEPAACEGLSERACLRNADCEAVYSYGDPDGTVCDCDRPEACDCAPPEPVGVFESLRGTLGLQRRDLRDVLSVRVRVRRRGLSDL